MMNKKNIMIGIACGLLIIAGIVYCFARSAYGLDTPVTASLSESGICSSAPQEICTDIPSKVPSDNITESPIKDDDNRMIYIHICGAVVKPGVYQLKTGGRVFDAIELSGGLTEAAAGDYINQAKSLSDGERVYIPTAEDVKELSASQLMQGEQGPSKNEEASGLVNINTATAEELMTLPGIGQSKADSIIEYRTANGSFKTIEDLKSISGIKEGVFNRISPFITAEQTTG